MSTYQFPDCKCKFNVLSENPLTLEFNPEISSIPLNCTRTWDLFGRGDCHGVFQLASYLGKSLAKQLKPTNIEQLSALIAIMRPGCLEAIQDGKSITQRYIDRKNGEEEVSYFHPALENALKSTYGVMCYQEQSMQIARDIAGFDLQQADILRKAIGKKKTELMAKVKVQFLKGCSEQKIVTDDQAKQIFELIEKSQRYSFNRSHSVSYALNAYLSAYAKAHFKKAFFTSYLYYAREKQKPMEEIHELVNNARLNRVDICIPDFRLMNPHFKLINQKIYFGFVDIRGIGETSINSVKHIENLIHKQLNKPKNDWTWTEFLLFFTPQINTTAIKSLIAVGSLGHMEQPRTKMLYEYDIFSQLNKKEQLWLQNAYLSQTSLDFEGLLNMLCAAPPGRKEGAGCSNKTRRAKVCTFLRALQDPPYSLTDSIPWIMGVEEELLGISVSCTDLPEKMSEANFTCRDVVEKRKWYGPIIIAGTIDKINIIKTKKGKKPGQQMAFMTISDKTGVLDSIVVFPKVFKEYKKLLYVQDNVLLCGKRGKKDDSFIVDKIWALVK